MTIKTTAFELCNLVSKCSQLMSLQRRLQMHEHYKLMYLNLPKHSEILDLHVSIKLLSRHIVRKVKVKREYKQEKVLLRNRARLGPV